MSEYHSAGKTTLTPDVLLTIARMAALEVDGVVSLAPTAAGVRQLFKRRNEGVLVEILDGIVYVDLFLILKADANIREVGREVQQHVVRVISEITGLDVGHVNIHVEDVTFA